MNTNIINALKVFSLTDLTSLNDNDTDNTIRDFCKLSYIDGKLLGRDENETVAAICVYPRFLKLAREIIESIGNKRHISLACVINFPYGTDHKVMIMEQLKYSIDNRVDEVDLVFPYVDFLKGDKEKAFDIVKSVREKCTGNIKLKVILETGVLSDASLIKEACSMVMACGADFIKTSTGKAKINATVESVKVILDEISRQQKLYGLYFDCGLKVSGGIKTVSQAMEYIDLAQKIMGHDWIKPKNIRFGASSLVLDIMAILNIDMASIKSKQNTY